MKIPSLAAALLACASALAQTPAPDPSAASLPRVFLDTTYAPPSGKVIQVHFGGKLQAAIDAASPGDTLVLQAGAVFAGPITLPNKGPGTAWIYVRSSAYASLPAPGNRVSPSDAVNMPKIVGAGNDAIALRTAAGAHHFRFVGIEFAPSAGAWTYGIIQLGGGETEASAIPHNIVIDRCYIHGDPTRGGRRGIALNSASTAVIDSHLSDWKEAGSDSQAIVGWSTPGPVKIVNNFLEGAAENIMFGGADPRIPGLVPSDIEIRGNYVSKPVAWRTHSPPWTVKNLLELKNALRVLIEGNVFETTWQHGQDTAIVISTINQSKTAPWSTTGDITFRRNIVRHAPNAINICGFGCSDGTPNVVTGRYLVENNLFEDIDPSKWGGSGGRLILVTSQARNVVVNRNTIENKGSMFFMCGEPSSIGKFPGMRFTGNVVNRGSYGFICTNYGPGNGSFNAYFPDGVMSGNVIVGARDAPYPADNVFVATAPRPGQFPSAGADMALLNAATRCSVSGKCAP